MTHDGHSFYPSSNNNNNHNIILIITMALKIALLHYNNRAKALFGSWRPTGRHEDSLTNHLTSVITPESTRGSWLW